MRMHQPAELLQDANEAMSLLREGNARFLGGELSDKGSYTADRAVLQGGQNPFAVIVTCADSRVAPEIYFDQKLGDLFVVRNAGNVCDATALGSIEYAVEHLGTRLVVICGHSKCGAVAAAVGGGELPPNIRQITDQIQPAVARGGDVDQVSRHHVEEMAAIVRENEIVQHCGATVAGAFYDLRTGEVSWL